MEKTENTLECGNFVIKSDIFINTLILKYKCEILFYIFILKLASFFMWLYSPFNISTRKSFRFSLKFLINVVNSTAEIAQCLQTDQLFGNLRGECSIGNIVLKFWTRFIRRKNHDGGSLSSGRLERPKMKIYFLC